MFANVSVKVKENHELNRRSSERCVEEDIFLGLVQLEDRGEEKL